MEIVGCDMLREVTRGCRLVLLTATEAEAEPLRAAFVDPEQHSLATKTLYVGDLAGEQPREIESKPKAPIPAMLAISGCDKTNVTHALTSLLQAISPAPLLVLQVGIAGALPGVGSKPGVEIGDLVVATQEVYSDTGSSSPDGWIPAEAMGLPIAQVDGTELGGAFPIDRGLVRAAVKVMGTIDWTGVEEAELPPTVRSGPFVTSSMVTGLRSEAERTARRWGALAESMEGAAAAHVCALYKVPFLEIRGISNLVGDRDRGAWQVDRAVATAARAALAVVAALDDLPLERRGEGKNSPGTKANGAGGD